MSPWGKCLALQASWHKVQTKGLLTPLSFNEGLSSPVPPGNFLFPRSAAGAYNLRFATGGGKETPDGRKMYPGCFKPVLRVSLAGPRQTDQQKNTRRQLLPQSYSPATNKAQLAGTYTGCLADKVDPSAPSPVVREVVLASGPWPYTQGTCQGARPHDDDEQPLTRSSISPRRRPARLHPSSSLSPRSLKRPRRPQTA